MKSSTVLRRLGSIPKAEIEKAEKAKLRVTVKGFFFCKGEVFIFHREGRVSLPGGGNDDETLAETFLREAASEELFGVKLSLRKVREAPVLKVGTLPTTKRWFKGKRTYVIAVYLKDLKAITIKEQIHYNPLILSVGEAIEYFKHHEGTPLQSRKFYVAALRKLAKLKGWKV